MAFKYSHGEDVYNIQGVDDTSINVKHMRWKKILFINYKLAFLKLVKR